jgi:hypothetical protein
LSQKQSRREPLSSSPCRSVSSDGFQRSAVMALKKRLALPGETSKTKSRTPLERTGPMTDS